MTSPGTSSIVDLSHTNQHHLPPIIIPAAPEPPAPPFKVDAFMLFCADQTSSPLPVKATPVLYERWNALPQESKRPYHHQAIIVNTRSEEGDNDQITYITTSQSYKSYPAPPPPRQLVSPEAIRSAELEEKEEALGEQPFSGYSSFLSMKYSHEQHRSTHDDTASSSPPSISFIPADESPTLTRSSTPSPSPTSSLRNYLSFPASSSTSASVSPSASTSMITSNLLPPPMLNQLPHAQKPYDARYLSDRHTSQQHYGQQTTIPDDKSQATLLSTCAASKSMHITAGYSQLRDIETGTMTTSLDTIYNSPLSPINAPATPLAAPTSVTSKNPTSRKRRSGPAGSSVTFERLKRPPNAYLLFNRDMRCKLLALDPKLTVSEISKEIGERWKFLSPDERQRYNEAAQALKTDHKKNHPDFIYTRRSKAELAEAKRTAKGGRKKWTAGAIADRQSTTTPSVPTPPTYSDLMRQPSISIFTSSQVPLYSQGRFPSTSSTDHPLYSQNASPGLPNTPNSDMGGGSIISSSIPSTTKPGKRVTTTKTTSTTSTTTTAAIKTEDHQPPSGKKRGRRRSENGQRDPRGRKKKRHKHPTAPKHPMSGFLFFLGAVRPEVAQQFPGSTVGPISKEISSRWRGMSAKEREPWLLKAESDKARYAQEMQLYMARQQEQEQQQQQQQQQQQHALSPTMATQTSSTPLASDQGHGNNEDGGHWHDKRKHISGGGRGISDFDSLQCPDDDGDGDVGVDDQVIATVVQMVNSGNGPTPLPSGTHPYSYSHPHLSSSSSSSSPFSLLPLSHTPSSSVYSSPIPLNKASNIVPL